MTLERVAPSSRMNMASSSPVSDCSWQTAAIKNKRSAIARRHSHPVKCLNILTLTVEALHLAIELARDSDGLRGERLAGGLGDRSGDLGKGRSGEAGGEEGGGGLHLECVCKKITGWELGECERGGDGMCVVVGVSGS